MSIELYETPAASICACVTVCGCGSKCLCGSVCECPTWEEAEIASARVPSGVRTLAIALAALFAIRGPSIATAQTSDSTARFSIGSAQTMAGVVRFDFADLDARFAAAGLPKVANTAGAIGLGTDVRAGRLLFGGGFQSLLTRNRTETEYRTRTSGGYSLFDLGFAVVQTRRMSIYPVAGIGASHLSINVRSLGDFSFDDGLHSPCASSGCPARRRSRTSVCSPSNASSAGRARNSPSACAQA